MIYGNKFMPKRYMDDAERAKGFFKNDLMRYRDKKNDRYLKDAKSSRALAKSYARSAMKNGEITEYEFDDFIDELDRLEDLYT